LVYGDIFAQYTHSRLLQRNIHTIPTRGAHRLISTVGERTVAPDTGLDAGPDATSGLEVEMLGMPSVTEVTGGNVPSNVAEVLVDGVALKAANTT